MPRRRTFLVVLLVAVMATGGYFAYRWYAKTSEKKDPPPPPVVRSHDPIAVAKVRFRDITDQAGIRFIHHNGLSGKKLLPETMGSGVAFLDYDNDGFQDLFFVNASPWPGSNQAGPVTTSVLYRNQGDGSFVDVTKTVGLDVPMYGLGVAVGDYDNDGYVDLFVSTVGKHRLFRNVDGKRFQETTDLAGVGGVGKLPEVSRSEFLGWKEPIPFGASCTFLDYDGDSKLDLFVCHYVTWSPKLDTSIEASLGGGRRDFVQPKDFEAAYCALYRNLGNGKFEDVSESAGVRVFDKDQIGETAKRRPVGKSLGVVICDPDHDGWPDLLVANDTTRNFFFHNVPGPDNTRRFEETGYLIGAAYADEGKPRGGMGIDWGEFMPGRFAALIANFSNEPNTFLSLEEKKPLRFTDSALAVCLAGPSREWLKFGAFFFDYDLDGRLDLLTCNGHIEPDIASIQSMQTYAQPAQLFWNTGNPERLYEAATAHDVGEDLFKPLVGRGSAFADLLNRGQVAVVLTANGGPARLLQTEYQGPNRWIRLQLHGDGIHSNRSAIGARIVVEVGGRKLERQVTGGRGYLSQSELPLTIGIGDAEKVDRIRIDWPGRDHVSEIWTEVDGKPLRAGQTYHLKQGSSRK